MSSRGHRRARRQFHFRLQQDLGCAHSRDSTVEWRLREVIRRHCAASAQGFAEERLDGTGRGLGARWKQSHVSPSPLPMIPRAASGSSDYERQRWCGGAEKPGARNNSRRRKGFREGKPRAGEHAKLRRVTAAELLRKFTRVRATRDRSALHSTTAWQLQSADALRWLHLEKKKKKRRRRLLLSLFLSRLVS